jgi:MFS family permease
VSAYKLGLIVGGSGLLLAIDRIGWHASFLTLAAMLVVLSLPILLLRERPGSNEPPGVKPAESASQRQRSDGFWQTTRGFFHQSGMLSWLCVLLAYKSGDALGSGMVKPMLVDTGYSLSAIGSVTLIASLAGMGAAILGGLLYYRLGAKITLLGFGLMQALGIGAYALIAQGYTSLTTLYSVAVFEQVADGMSTVVLFALMMEQCRTNHEGADYSIQACIQVILAGLIGVTSGWVAIALGYNMHFLVSGLLGLVALLPAWYYLRRYAPAAPANVSSPGGAGNR